MTFIELARKILEEERRPLSVDEIWALAQVKGYDKHIGSIGKTPAATLSAQIYVHMKNKADSPFIKMDSRPQRFYLKYLFDKTGQSIPIVEELPVALHPKKFDYLERGFNL